jgi:SH3-like domain-containing protein
VTGLRRALKAIAGIAILVVLVVIVNSWMGQYRIAAQRVAKEATSTVEATSTATATSTPTPVAQVVPLLVARDVPLRTAPASKAKVVRMLKKGEKLTVVSSQLPWIRVRDGAGRSGYVLNDSHVKPAQ